MIGRLFKRQPMLDDGTRDWILDAFGWALANFGDDVFYDETDLVTPTDEFFPDVRRTDDLAERIFERVRTLAGMAEWHCELVAQEPDEEALVAEHVLIQNAPRGPAGTFSVAADRDAVMISYNPALIAQPEALIATFAHELGHYLGVTAKSPPPGGDKFWEPATDLLAVVMGFGIFLANSAFSFRQFHTASGHGWQSSTQGYLSPQELSFALAVFTTLKAISPKDVERYLNPSPRSWFRRACKELGGRDSLTERVHPDLESS